MRGILFKQYNIWKVEYDEVKNNKTIKKEIELHPDDIVNIDDDGEYANNFDFREVFFDIVFIPSKINKCKIVAKLIQKEIPTIKIELNQLDEDGQDND
jgi:hypothetical protein